MSKSLNKCKTESNSTLKSRNKTNKVVIAMISVFAATIALGIAIHIISARLYSPIDFQPLSALHTLKDNVTAINDEDYLNLYGGIDKEEDAAVPRFELSSDGVISFFPPEEAVEFHITNVYTGDTEFVFDRMKWNALVEEGKKHPENPSSGWTTGRSGVTNLALEHDGWYVVFGIWHDEAGVKKQIYQSFKKGVSPVVDRHRVEEIQAYENWKINKERVEKIPGVQNILILGVDHSKRFESSEGYSDSIVLITVNNNSKKISVTTLSKETLVYIPTVGCGRLTNAYNCGGKELAIKTVRENYGIFIDQFVLVDYASFINSIDAIGGIEVNLEKEQTEYINDYIQKLSDDQDAGIISSATLLKNTSGKKTLDGTQALAYLRYYQDGDYDRAGRYNNVISQFIKALSEKGIDEISKNIFPQVTTNISYNDFCQALCNYPYYSKYETVYNVLPKEEKKADFKENGKFTVLLLDHEKANEIIAGCITEEQSGGGYVDMFTLIIGVYIVWLVLIASFILFEIFVYPRHIIYIDRENNRKFLSERKYKWREFAYIYDENLVDCDYEGMFADSDCTLEYSHKIKMPMHILEVYLKCENIERAKACAEREKRQCKKPKRHKLNQKHKISQKHKIKRRRMSK